MTDTHRQPHVFQWRRPQACAQIRAAEHTEMAKGTAANPTERGRSIVFTVEETDFEGTALPGGGKLSLWLVCDLLFLFQADL